MSIKANESSPQYLIYQNLYNFSIARKVIWQKLFNDND